MALRETGLDAVQASVPLSRSLTIRAITASTAATTKICPDTAPTTIVSGSVTRFAGASCSAGMFAWSHTLSAVRTMNRVLTISTTQVGAPGANP